MAVVLLSRDLMGAARIEGAARLAGTGYRMVGSLDAALEACAANRTLLLFVDLTTPGLDISQLVDRADALATGAPKIIAYGPHVHEAALAAAKSAGCDEVLSRGQFMSRVDALIAAQTAQ